MKLNVEAEKLKNTSERLSNKVDEINAAWKDVKHSVKDMKSYWSGEAYNEHMKRFDDKLIQEIDNAVKNLKADKQKLITIAGEYLNTELKIEQRIQTLPDDLIV